MRTGFCAIACLSLLTACGEAAQDTAPIDDDAMVAADAVAEDAEEASGDAEFCGFTGKREEPGDCARMEEDYNALAAGTDAYDPRASMTENEPNEIRYAITRLPDAVQGGGGELAEAVPEQTPVPADTPDAIESPEPVEIAAEAEAEEAEAPVEIEAETVEIRSASVEWQVRPIPLPDEGTMEPDREAVALPGEDARIRSRNLPARATVNGQQSDRVEDRVQPVMAEEPVSEPGPAPPPPPSPTPTGPTQAELDQALAEAEQRVTGLITVGEAREAPATGIIKMGTLMYACLEGNPALFEIQSADSQEPGRCHTINTRERPDPVWTWTVTPKGPAKNASLMLYSGIEVRAADGTPRRIGGPSRTVEIEVQVTNLGMWQRFTAQAEQWVRSPLGLIAALTALAVALGSLIGAIKRARRGEGPEETEPEAKPEV